jgi:hypothetical protein
VGILDVRATIEIREEALIYVTYTGWGTREKTGIRGFFEEICLPSSRCA